MLDFKYQKQSAQIHFYSQKLITTSLDVVYGQELLCRGLLTKTKEPIPTYDLIHYCCQHPQLLLELTCKQIEVSVQNYTTKQPLISFWINIAGPLIADPHLFELFWQRSLNLLSPAQKSALVLEICESDIGDDMVIKRLEFLKQNGFIIAMDDFGSGHSNLLRLNQAEFDIIKLDLELLKNVPTDLWASSFYREIVDLCASKGCLVVAEGVETQTQSDFVRWAGIDLIQGFLYSKPEPLLLKVLP